MALMLNDDIRFCWVGDHPLFVDITKGRYFCLTARMERAFRAFLDSGDDPSADAPGLDALVCQGLLVERDPPTDRCPSLPIPAASQDLVAGRDGKAGPLALARAAYCESLAALIHGRRPLREIEAALKRWRARSTGGSLSPEQRMRHYRDVSAAFERTALLYRPADRCLTKALAFLLVCRSYRLHPFLVFGVRTNPFAAHCWVQDGPLVVNDELERVRIFTPILVL